MQQMLFWTVLIDASKDVISYSSNVHIAIIEMCILQADIRMFESKYKKMQKKIKLSKDDKSKIAFEFKNWRKILFLTYQLNFTLFRYSI